MATVIPFPTRREPTAAGQVLTPRGQACAHLLRFERAWRTLSAADRGWFAETLRHLAAEAAAADRPPD
jgi:hypothetical protein